MSSACVGAATTTAEVNARGGKNVFSISVGGHRYAAAGFRNATPTAARRRYDHRFLAGSVVGQFFSIWDDKELFYVKK